MTSMKETFDLKRIQDEVVASSRKVWLAGLGAVATGVEEGQSLFDELVKRGKKAEELGRKSWNRTRKQVASTTDEMGDRFEKLGSRLDEGVSDILQKMGVPSRNQVEELTERVERLTNQVERLTRTPKRATTRKSTAKKSTTKAA